MLEVQMPRLKALKTMEAVDAGTLNLHPDSLWEVAKLATGSEAIANAYRVAAIKARWKPQG